MMNQQTFVILHPSLQVSSSPPSSIHSSTGSSIGSNSIHSENFYYSSSPPSGSFTSSSSLLKDQIQIITKTGEHCINTPLSPFQIKIQVKCCGLSKLDSQVRRGIFPLWKNRLSSKSNENSQNDELCSCWIIPGYEVSGVVIQVGKKVNPKVFSVGDCVMGFIPVQNLNEHSTMTQKPVSVKTSSSDSNEKDDMSTLHYGMEWQDSELESSSSMMTSPILPSSLNGGCSTECVADAHFFVKIPTGMSFIKASSAIMCGIRAYDTLFFKCASTIRQGDVIFVSSGARWEQTYLLQLAVLLAKCRVITTVHTDEEINFLRMISSRLTSSTYLRHHHRQGLDSSRSGSTGDNFSSLYGGRSGNLDDEENDGDSMMGASNSGGTGSPPFDTQYISSVLSMMRSGNSAINPLVILDRRLYDTPDKLQQAIMKETNGLGVQLVVLGESALIPPSSTSTARTSSPVKQQNIDLPQDRNPITRFIDMCLNVLSTHGTIAFSEYCEHGLTASHLEYMYSKSIAMTNIFEQSYVQNTNLMGRYLHILNNIVKDIHEEHIEIPIAHCLPLSSVRDAHRKLDSSIMGSSSSSFVGKIIIKM
ncbi:hypothetical protein FDP41_009788 [Naegleria fowleri]|uniref:Alcohol dehydrogenase-like N-terminal domain-containing protein n=1 Tax=Naegleria fowleri TaxID=5763 RepID=A0A6A5BAI6_NAEFO|nr:uncharacterized protein FDP41_009788 [Naegleria fowleri]KAF0972092.1 hypothetical protein FDP41_009788 [Naegleria fowleri]